MKSTGTRVDITVPYTTSGNSTFMNGAVAPRIYSSPIVDDPSNPQARPVFNLPFYGGKQSFGDRSNGAKPRPRCVPPVPDFTRSLGPLVSPRIIGLEANHPIFDRSALVGHLAADRMAVGFLPGAGWKQGEKEGRQKP